MEMLYQLSYDGVILMLPTKTAMTVISVTALPTVLSYPISVFFSIPSIQMVSSGNEHDFYIHNILGLEINASPPDEGAKREMRMRE